MSGVGSDTWRALWKAAQTYSNDDSGLGGTFPVVVGDALCVLCQQPLGDEGKARLLTFSEFVEAATERAVEETWDAIKERARRLSGLSLPRVSETWAVDAGAQGDDRQALREHMVRLKCRLRACRLALAGEEISAPVGLKDCGILREIEVALAADLKAAQAAKNAGERAGLEEEHRSIADRVRLSDSRAVLAAEIERLTAVYELKQLEDSCGTQGITRKQGAAERLVITNRFNALFRKNLTALGFSRDSRGHGRRGGQPGEAALRSQDLV